MSYVPERKRRRLKNTFLRLYKKAGQLNLAIEKAEICLRTHYCWIESDPEYRKRFEEIRRSRSQILIDRHADRVRKSKAAFLRYYKKFGRIVFARKKVGIGHATHFYWLHKDSEYRNQFEQITEELRLNPPRTMVRLTRKRNPQSKPSGLGSVQRIGARAFKILYQTGPKGSRETVRERLDNVSEAEAWRILQGRLKEHPPLVGPIRFGHMPSIESMLSNHFEDTTKNIADGRLQKRRSGDGSIRTYKTCRVIRWTDVDGKEHLENVGQVSLQQAESLLRERTDAVRAVRERAKAIALQLELQLPADPTPTSSKPRGGRPRNVDHFTEREDCRAAATMKPRAWLEVRDKLQIPLTPTVEKFGSWTKAYDSDEGDTRQRLAIIKSQKARAHRDRTLTKTS